MSVKVLAIASFEPLHERLVLVRQRCIIFWGSMRIDTSDSFMLIVIVTKTDSSVKVTDYSQ